MKNTGRRNFLRASLSGMALAAIGSRPAYASVAGTQNQPAVKNNLSLNLSFQEGTAPGKSLAEKFDFMEKHGIIGFEPGGSGLAKRVSDIKKELTGRNIRISSICAGFRGFILSTDEKVRQEFMDTMSEIIVAAGELGALGVIMVPAFNSQQPVFPHTLDTRNFLCEKLRELGEIAAQNQTTVILEPLNRTEAFYLRQVGDAASICRDINHPGVRCMGDFWHMTLEENSDMGAFLSAGDYLQHVHIASRKRRSMPGEDGVVDNYVDGFRALKMLNYQHFVSFECGCVGDRNVVLPAAVKLLREQWEMA